MTVDSHRFWCIVPAAGSGRRMGAELPKQYLPLLGKTLCEHTLDRLLDLPCWERVLVCVAPGDSMWHRLPVSQYERIVTVAGGNERSDSVLNALQALAHEAVADDWVLVHDVARPCVLRADIERLIETVEADTAACGGILATPVRDTMKRADAYGYIAETVERSGLWHALTPQMFRFGLLYDALQQASDAGVTITDEASALEWAGHAPLLVEGRADNIKATRPADLPLIIHTLQQQHAAQENAE